MRRDLTTKMRMRKSPFHSLVLYRKVRRDCWLSLLLKQPSVWLLRTTRTIMQMIITVIIHLPCGDGCTNSVSLSVHVTQASAHWRSTLSGSWTTKWKDSIEVNIHLLLERFAMLLSHSLRWVSGLNEKYLKLCVLLNTLVACVAKQRHASHVAVFAIQSGLSQFVLFDTL